MKALFGKVGKVSIVNLKDIWPEIPTKGDISDYFDKCHLEGKLPDIGLPVELQEFINRNLESSLSEKDSCLPDTAEITHPHSTIIHTIPRYDLVDGRICRVAEDEMKPLATGSIIIKRQIIKNDGNVKSVSYELEGITDDGHMLPLALVPAEKLAAMAWMPNVWGMQLNIMPGRTIKDYLNFVITESGRFAGTYHYVFSYHGFREINGTPAYLYHGGAIGAENIDVQLETESLQKYHQVPSVFDIPVAITASLKTIEAHEPGVTIPLLCAIYLAPLRYILCQLHLEPTFLIFLLGPTQAGKSTIAALMMNHFGTFTRTTPPASFTGTVNSLRRIMNLIGDAVVWIDDYYPQSSAFERRKMENMAQALLRAAGDGADRTRMNSSLLLQQGQPPRGLAIITGEDQPGVSQSGIHNNSVVLPIEPLLHQEPRCLDRMARIHTTALRAIEPFATFAYGLHERLFLRLYEINKKRIKQFACKIVVFRYITCIP